MLRSLKKQSTSPKHSENIIRKIDGRHPSLKFINRDRIWLNDQRIKIVERDAGGEGTLNISLKHSSMAMRPKSNLQPITWTSEKKCADAAVVEFDPSGIKLHIIEMKSALTVEEWINARRQCYGMFINSLALKGIFDFEAYKSIIVYIAYTSDRVSVPSSANSILLKTPVGGSSSFARIEDWKKKSFELADGVVVPIVGIQRDSEGNAELVI